MIDDIVILYTKEAITASNHNLLRHASDLRREGFVRASSLEDRLRERLPDSASWTVAEYFEFI